MKGMAYFWVLWNYYYCPTLKHHLDSVKEKQEKGEHFHVHYLSWKCQNEFIELCAKKVKGVILEEIKESYYYGLIVDGTPDVSHTEQLTFITIIIRYLLWSYGFR